MLIFRKVITNLKYWGSSEIIISKTLHLLSELSVGYGTVRKLVKLEEVGGARQFLGVCRKRVRPICGNFT